MGLVMSPSRRVSHAHVAWVAQGGGGGRHDGGHQLVDNAHVWRVHLEPVRSDAVQSVVVEHNLVETWVKGDGGGGGGGGVRG